MSTLSPEAVARALRAQGVPAHAIARVVPGYASAPDRAATGEPGAMAGPSRVACELPPDAREATVQRAVIARLHALGFRVWRIGQYVARGTQDPGVPDVYAIHRTRPLRVWVECKRRTGGVQSAAQRAFAVAVTAAGGEYVLAHDPAVIDAWWRARVRGEG